MYIFKRTDTAKHHNYKGGNIVVAQATGQLVFPLKPTAKNVFIFAKAGVKMEFGSTKKTILLKQHGSEFLFTAK